MSILKRNQWLCLKCNYVVASIHRHDYNTCKCGNLSVDGGTDYIKITGDLNNIQDMCEYVEAWGDGDKIRCIDDSEQNTLKLNEVYTVDKSMNTTEDRVYIKENKRFSFLKSRFKLVEE